MRIPTLLPALADANGLWNSVFIKNETTVTAISGTTMSGVRGLWTIDGRLERPGTQAAGTEPVPAQDGLGAPIDGRPGPRQ